MNGGNIRLRMTLRINVGCLSLASEINGGNIRLRMTLKIHFLWHIQIFLGIPVPTKRNRGPIVTVGNRCDRTNRYSTTLNVTAAKSKLMSKNLNLILSDNLTIQQQN